MQVQNNSFILMCFTNLDRFWLVAFTTNKNGGVAITKINVCLCDGKPLHFYWKQYKQGITVQDQELTLMQIPCWLIKRGGEEYIIVWVAAEEEKWSLIYMIAASPARFVTQAFHKLKDTCTPIPTLGLLCLLTLFSDLEDAGSVFLGNVLKLLPDYTASQPRRQYTLYT